MANETKAKGNCDAPRFVLGLRMQTNRFWKHFEARHSLVSDKVRSAEQGSLLSSRKIKTFSRLMHKKRSVKLINQCGALLIRALIALCELITFIARVLFVLSFHLCVYEAICAKS